MPTLLFASIIYSLCLMLQSSGHRDLELERCAEGSDLEGGGLAGREGGDNVLLQLLEVEERSGGGGRGNGGEGHYGGWRLGHAGGERGVGVEDISVAAAEKLQ